jgi:hypothetical protein
MIIQDLLSIRAEPQPEPEVRVKLPVQQELVRRKLIVEILRAEPQKQLIPDREPAPEIAEIRLQRLKPVHEVLTLHLPVLLKEDLLTRPAVPTIVREVPAVPIPVARAVRAAVPAEEVQVVDRAEAAEEGDKNQNLLKSIKF